MLNEDIEKEVLISDNENKTESIVRNSFKEYSKKVDWIVFLLICLFTLGICLFHCIIFFNLNLNFKYIRFMVGY